mmetsp:Transcript_307/g.560  ORF Transcript_307/g.560 Transcript_307/m.560 type:complete len:621 (+) Transcript_307:32-1894(+)
MVNSKERYKIEDVDDIILEYLTYRGFNETINSFREEKTRDKRYNLKPDKIVERLFALIQRYDYRELMEYWNYLDREFFARYVTIVYNDNQNISKTIKVLGTNLQQYFLVHAFETENKKAIFEFLSEYGDILSQEEKSWAKWFTLPFLSEKPKSLEHFFSPQWLELLKVSLTNFISVSLSSIPKPKILKLSELIQEKKKVEKQLSNLQNDYKILQDSYHESYKHNIGGTLERDIKEGRIPSSTSSPTHMGYDSDVHPTVSPQQLNSSQLITPKRATSPKMEVKKGDVSDFTFKKITIPRQSLVSYYKNSTSKNNDHLLKIKFSPKGKHIAALNYRGDLIIYSRGKTIEPIGCIKSRVLKGKGRDIYWINDIQLLIRFDKGSHLGVYSRVHDNWSYKSEDLNKEIKQISKIRALLDTHDGIYMAIAYKSGKGQLIKTDYSLSLKREYLTINNAITSVISTSNGKMIVCGDTTGRIHLIFPHSKDDQQVPINISNHGGIASMCLTHDETKLFILSSTNSLFCYDMHRSINHHIYDVGAAPKLRNHILIHPFNRNFMLISDPCLLFAFDVDNPNQVTIFSCADVSNYGLNGDWHPHGKDFIVAQGPHMYRVPIPTISVFSPVSA